MKRVAFAIWLFLCLLCFVPLGHCQYVTLTGIVQASNGLTANNYTINFKISQFGFIAGTGAVVNTSTFCATSIDGSVVGIGNPLTPSVVTPAFVGSLPIGNYYVVYAFYNQTAGTTTLVSPETISNLTGTGELQVAPPVSGIPAGSTGMAVYIGTSSGSETLQGTTHGSGTYTQNVPLVSGSALPSTNTTVCTQVANDAIWPVGTGYTVSLSDTSGNTLPGYPMLWQLLGPNTTINVSNGLPYYHGVVTYPVPILASPLNHGTQSISGPLSLTNYALLNVLKMGVGTSLPAYPIDVQNGSINATGGFLVNGSAGSSGQCLSSNGTVYNTPVSCLTSTAGIFYQTIENGNTPVTQKLTLQVGTGTGLIAASTLGPPGVTILSTDSTIPTVGTTAVGQAVCQYAAGPPVVLGHCTTAVNGSGACVCAN